jgi:hypothetical protein
MSSDVDQSRHQAVAQSSSSTMREEIKMMTESGSVVPTSARATGGDELRLTSSPFRCWCDGSVFDLFIDSLLSNADATDVVTCRHRASLRIRCVQRIAECIVQYSGRDSAGTTLSLRGHPWPQ